MVASDNEYCFTKISPMLQSKCRVVTHFDSKIEYPDDFTSRTMGALNKIAEEHWKRQMKHEKKEEELVSNLHSTESSDIATGVLQALQVPAHLSLQL